MQAIGRAVCFDVRAATNTEDSPGSADVRQGPLGATNGSGQTATRTPP